MSLGLLQHLQQLVSLTSPYSRKIESQRANAKALEQTSKAIQEFNSVMKDLTAPKRENKDGKDPMIV